MCFWTSAVFRYLDFAYVIFRMAPPVRGKFRWTLVIPTGVKKRGSTKRTNRRWLVPARMYPCRIEEKLTLSVIGRTEVELYETKLIHKDGSVVKYLGQCPDFLEDGVVLKPRDLYAFADGIDEECRRHKEGFASHPQPELAGSMNGWISDEDEVDSDLESTASNTLEV